MFRLRSTFSWESANDISLDCLCAESTAPRTHILHHTQIFLMCAGLDVDVRALALEALASCDPSELSSIYTGGSKQPCDPAWGVRSQVCTQSRIRVFRLGLSTGEDSGFGAFPTRTLCTASRSKIPLVILFGVYNRVEQSANGDESLSPWKILNGHFVGATTPVSVSSSARCCTR